MWIGLILTVLVAAAVLRMSAPRGGGEATVFEGVRGPEHRSELRPAQPLRALGMKIASHSVA